MPLCEVASSRYERAMATAPTGTKTSVSDPIYVSWIPIPREGRLGLSFAPGKHAAAAFQRGADADPNVGRWERDLAADLDALVSAHGMHVLVCLLGDDELAELQIAALVPEARQRGVEVLLHPMSARDGLPDGTTLGALVERCAAAIVDGKRVVVTCGDGLGRAGVVAGSILVGMGCPPAEALRLLAKHRSKRCPETDAQRAFVAQRVGPAAPQAENQAAANPAAE